MYQSHPLFIQPEDENIKIWRYIDFTKLISLLESKQLFFSRADKFEDPFEGSWPKLNVEERKEVPEFLSKAGVELWKKSKSKTSDLYKNWRNYIAINCWHANNHESAAMWKLYLKSNEGIAIQSTLEKYKKSIIDETSVFIGKVKYIDYDNHRINSTNIYNPFIHKRKSFEYENEIRGIVCWWPLEIGANDYTHQSIENGINIDIDINVLIEKIYIAPNSPMWFAELVNKVIEKYGYNFDIVQSKLNDDPLF